MTAVSETLSTYVGHEAAAVGIVALYLAALGLGWALRAVRGER